MPSGPSAFFSFLLLLSLPEDVLHLGGLLFLRMPDCFPLSVVIVRWIPCKLLGEFMRAYLACESFLYISVLIVLFGQSSDHTPEVYCGFAVKLLLNLSTFVTNFLMAIEECPHIWVFP